MQIETPSLLGYEDGKYSSKLETSKPIFLMCFIVVLIQIITNNKVKRIRSDKREKCIILKLSQK